MIKQPIEKKQVKTKDDHLKTVLRLLPRAPGR
jgi:hypothetical protein